MTRTSDHALVGKFFIEDDADSEHYRTGQVKAALPGMHLVQFGFFRKGCVNCFTQPSHSSVSR
jgi:hypothetical protein